MAKKLFTGKRVLFAAKGRVEIADWDVFEPQSGEVLFENVASLVSPGTELSHLFDIHTKPAAYPSNTGYISAGRIARVGPGVEKWKPGDVVLSGLGHVSHAVFPETHWFVPVPEGMELVDAVWAKLATIPIFGVQRAAVRIGSSVGVFGLGVIGQLAAQLARLAGGLPVIGVDLSEKRLELARSTGAHAVVNGSGDVATAVSKATGGYGLDCVIEVTGTPSVVHKLFDYCAPGAYVCILGGVHKPVTLDLYTHFQKKGITMVGSHTSNCPAEASPVYPYNMAHNLGYLLKAISTGALQVKPLTSRFVSFREAPAMYAALAEKTSDVIGVAFDWSETSGLSGAGEEVAKRG
ncbi:MAG TPA: zinc-binding alcohol dehydrogenase [Planctomycetes bacterium]|nr:zinc-binding alcohol dehydrogenase [Planctomycetota bacterium]